MFNKGQKVWCLIYGQGVVAEVDDENACGRYGIIVKFNDGLACYTADGKYHPKVSSPSSLTLSKSSRRPQNLQSTGATYPLNTTTSFRIQMVRAICAVRNRHVSKVVGLQSLPASLPPHSRPTFQEPAIGRIRLLNDLKVKHHNSEEINA